jgi:hypothetical protein
MDREHDEILAEAETLLRNLRLKGLDEETLQHFVAKYSGRQWEAFFEALFGYEAKLAARERLKGEAGRERARYGAWREPIIQWFETRVQARRAIRERKHLQTVEEKSLEAGGVQKAEAQRRAATMADVFVEEMEGIRRDDQRAVSPADRAARMRRLLETARRPERAYAVDRSKWRQKQLRRIRDRVLGPGVRALVGAALVTGCLLWVRQNDLISTEKVRQAAAAIQQSGDLQHRGEKMLEEMQGLGKETEAKAEGTTPLSLPGLPEFVANRFNSFKPGVVGLILILTAIFSGWRSGIAAWVGAFVAFGGARFGMPSIGPLTATQISLAIGAVIGVVGAYLLRWRR